MDLVDEEHVALFQVGEQRGEVTGLGNHRPRRGAEIHAKLAGDDLRQRGLAKARRTNKQHVIERLAPRPRRCDEHVEILACLLLTDELSELLRAQRGFRDVFIAAFGAQKRFCCHLDLRFKRFVTPPRNEHPAKQDRTQIYRMSDQCVAGARILVHEDLRYRAASQKQHQHHVHGIEASVASLYPRNCDTEHRSKDEANRQIANQDKDQQVVPGKDQQPPELLHLQNFLNRKSHNIGSDWPN